MTPAQVDASLDTWEATYSTPADPWADEPSNGG